MSVQSVLLPAVGEDRDGATAVGRDDVEVAVPVHVAHRHGGRLRAGRKVNPGCEGAIRHLEEDGDVVRVPVRRDDVRPPVPVQVTDRHRAGEEVVGGFDVGTGKVSAAVVVEHGNAAVRAHRHQVHVRVAVEVRRGHRGGRAFDRQVRPTPVRRCRDIAALVPEDAQIRRPVAVVALLREFRAVGRDDVGAVLTVKIGDEDGDRIPAAFEDR